MSLALALKVQTLASDLALRVQSLASALALRVQALALSVPALALALVLRVQALALALKGLGLILDGLPCLGLGSAASHFSHLIHQPCVRTVSPFFIVVPNRKSAVVLPLYTMVSA